MDKTQYRFIESCRENRYYNYYPTKCTKYSISFIIKFFKDFFFYIINSVPGFLLSLKLHLYESFHLAENINPSYLAVFLLQWYFGYKALTLHFTDAKTG